MLFSYTTTRKAYAVRLPTLSKLIRTYFHTKNAALSTYESKSKQLFLYEKQLLGALTLFQVAYFIN